MDSCWTFYIGKKFCYRAVKSMCNTLESRKLWGKNASFYPRKGVLLNA